MAKKNILKNIKQFVEKKTLKVIGDQQKKKPF
jgi:hypothetical protein